MNFKNIKLTALSLITLSFIIIFTAVKPNLSSSDFSLFDFSRGMLAGMSGVVAVVWLIFLISNIIKTKKMKDKQNLLSTTMFILLIGTIFISFYSDNPFLLAAGALIMCTAMAFNILNIKNFLSAA